MKLASVTCDSNVQVGGHWRTSLTSEAYEIELHEQSGVISARHRESGARVVISPHEWRYAKPLEQEQRAK